MIEDQTPKVRRDYAPETLEPREVSRLIDRRVHVISDSVANFMGDLADMLTDGEFYNLNPHDIRLLSHLYRAGVRTTDTSGGPVVLLSGRQWGGFVGIRRKYLEARRQPANLVNHLRAIRATA